MNKEKKVYNIYLIGGIPRRKLFIENPHFCDFSYLFSFISKEFVSSAK